MLFFLSFPFSRFFFGGEGGGVTTTIISISPSFNQSIQKNTNIFLHLRSFPIPCRRTAAHKKLFRGTKENPEFISSRLAPPPPYTGHPSLLRFGQRVPHTHITKERKNPLLSPNLSVSFCPNGEEEEEEEEGHKEEEEEEEERGTLLISDGVFTRGKREIPGGCQMKIQSK